MNPRAFLVTATLTLSLIVPSAASALRYTIPPDVSLSKQPAAHLNVLEARSSTLGVRAYKNWAAYVRGGASQEVSKAITAAASTRTRNVCANDAQSHVPC
jgi:hypothetical protein